MDKKKDKYILCLYLTLETALFFLIKWAEFTQPYAVTGKIMYGSILLNFCVMLLFYVRYRGDRIIPMALTVTLIADYFLTYRNEHFYAGVFCFILVQLIYGWRIGYDRRRVRERILLFLCFAVILFCLGMSALFSFFCGLSIALLLGNVIFSWESWLKRDRKSRVSACGPDSQRRMAGLLFAIGLTLFAGCDLSLGLRIISQDIPSMQLFHDIMNYLTWTFYLPSQVLLTLTYICETAI